MPAPTADKLQLYYIGAGTSGAALPTHTLAAGSTSQLLVTTAAIADAPGAIGWFAPDTSTVALRGQRIHIEAVEESGAYRLAWPLPATPAAGDQITIRASGSRPSTTPIFGMSVGGVLPELSPVAVSAITSLSILQASPALGAGTLTVAYTASTKKLKIKMGSGSYGPELDLQAATSPAYVFDAGGQGFVKVSWTTASLPTADASSPLTLAYIPGLILPDQEGYETHPSTGGKVRYYAVQAKNGDTQNTMLSQSVFLRRSSDAVTTIATGQSLTLAAGSIDLADASTFPVAGFWIKNITRSDCRYVTTRSGNTLTCRVCDWVTLTGDGTTAAEIGDTITQETSGATGVVVASQPGTAILKRVNGTFTAGHAAGDVGTVSAVVRGFRGYTAAAWQAGDQIELLPSLDIGLDTGAIETVYTETTIPAGITFGTPKQASPLSIGDMASSATAVLQLCEWILDGATPIDSLLDEVEFNWR